MAERGRARDSRPMLNFILAPLGLLLIALGVAGLYLAIRGPRDRDGDWQ